MARDDKRNAVGGIGPAHCASSGRALNHAGQLGVGARLSKRDTPERTPDGHLKGGTLQDDRDIEGTPLAGKEFQQFCAGLFCTSRVLAECEAVALKLLLKGKRVMAVK